MFWTLPCHLPSHSAYSGTTRGSWAAHLTHPLDTTTIPGLPVYRHSTTNGSLQPVYRLFYARKDAFWQHTDRKLHEKNVTNLVGELKADSYGNGSDLA